VWKLAVSAGRYADGSVRRLHRTVHVRGDVEASQALAEFVAEVRSATAPRTRVERDVTVDEAVERYLTEHLQQERGREQGTIEEYRGVHSKWFSPEIPVPAGWADEQALGLVVNWPTALAALKPLGRIAAGQTVLIHAAAGGTGQAAVKMAKHDGATVIARPRQASTRWYGRSAPTTSSTPAAPTSPPRSCD
jgi:NADPH:quinone reductase-like Zn-dependent oxidoreductase